MTVVEIGDLQEPGRVTVMRLTWRQNADIVSDMKTFTVRELDREPAAVLKVCDREGAVRIRSRSGRTYTIRPDAVLDTITSIPDFRARINRISPKVLTTEQTRLVDDLIAG